MAMQRGLDPVPLFLEVLGVLAVTGALVTLGLPLLAPTLAGVQQALLAGALLVLLAGPGLYWRCMVATRRAARAVIDERRVPSWEQTAQEAQARQSSRLRPAIAATAATQAAGLLVTGALLAWVWQEGERHAERRFEREAERIEQTVAGQFARLLHVLEGLRGTFAASSSVQRREFRAHVEAYGLMPGPRGVGFVERVLHEDLERFVAAERADDAPEFVVKGAGSAADHYVLKFVEPLEHNRKIFGRDLGAEPVRRAAIERAVASGQATLSGAVRLAQDDDGPGFLYMLPVYRNDAATATAERRRDALRGVAVVPVNIRALLLGTAGEGRVAGLRVRLFDGGNAAEPVFDTGGSEAPAPRTLRRPLVIGQRSLWLQVDATPAFEAGIDRSSLPLAAVGGAALSFAMALAVWLLMSARLRAEGLARRMTADLDRLAMVVRHTSNAVLITDAASQIVWVNPGFTQVSGYALDEARGQRPGSLLRSDACDPAAAERLRAAVRQGVAFRGEVCNRTRDGRDCWFEIDLQPLHDARGTLTGFMTIGTEISAQKQAEGRLAYERERLANILSGTNAGTWEWNVQSGETRFNDRWAEMLGYRLADLMPVGMETWMRLVHPDDLAGSSVALQRHFDGAADDYVCEARMRHKDGHWVWVLDRGRVHSRTPDGRPEWMSGTYLDISERKRFEQQLEDSARFMRLVTDHIPGMVAYWTPDLRCTYANSAYREWLGLDPALILGRHRREIVGEAMFVADEPYFRAALAGVEQRLERARMKPDGKEVQYLFHVVPDGHEGAVKGLVTVAMDVTDLKRAQTQLESLNEALRERSVQAEQASEAKGRFLANMSHEIRTPMNAVLGMLALLRKTVLTARQADFAAQAEGSARALLRLLNDILDFSKIEAGKLTLDPHPFAMSRLLGELSPILAGNLGDKPIELIYDIDPDLPDALVGDDLRLQQVLINLAGNAIKFTAAGAVTVRLRCVERRPASVRLAVTVVDTGIGIAPEHRDRIFAGFSQAESSTTRRYGGTGLGLAISQRLVALMGGRLELDSEPGRGSRFDFTIDLPLDASAVVAPPATPALRVLVVEGHDAARAALVASVRSLGWQVDAAADARAMQERLGEAPGYDAVFCDAAAAMLDGGGTLDSRWAASVFADDGRPLMLLLGTQGRAASDSTDAVFDACLIKPLTATMLRDAVERARAGDAAPAQPAAQGSARLAGLRVLLVEDNPTNQQIAAELLQDEGAEVALAGDGLQALLALQGGGAAFDVILMDLQMPGLDGLSATARIRQDMQLTLPIVAMTANVGASDRAACLAAGMNDHLGKPIDVESLVAALTRLCGRAVPATAANAPARLPEPLLVLARTAGIALEPALARLGGRRPAYRRMLLASADGIAASPDQLAGLLDSGRRDEALRLMHTMKGLTGTLGAVALAEHAAHCERTLAATAGDAAADAALCSAWRERVAVLTAGLPALAQALDESAGEPQAIASPSNADGAAQCAALAGLLAEGDMQALPSWDRLRAQAAATGIDAAELAGLDAAMASLDFEAALAACRALAARWPAEKAGAPC